MTTHSGPALAGTPVLETERLRLRAPQAGDWPFWGDFAMSERARYIGGPYTHGGAWRAFGHAIGMWVLRGFGNFVFHRKDEDRPLGMAGPWYPADWPEHEIGWTVWSDADEGRGLAFEAAIAARTHAYDVLGWTTAISLIDEANARSQRLARRLGCVPEGPVTLPGLGQAVAWRHPGPDALSDGGMEAYA
jgi:RimJ/RimL family protein N-acetyltransferase